MNHFERTSPTAATQKSARAKPEKYLNLFYWKVGRGPALGVGRARALSTKPKIMNARKSRLFSRATFFSIKVKVVQFFILYTTPLQENS